MSDIFIGRQPIFDQGMQVSAYELLYRQSHESNSAYIDDGDQATSQVILNSFIEVGLDKIVGNHKAFVNLTRVFLSDPDLMVLPPDRVVLEVLEDVEPSDIVINTLGKLKAQGHTIALDDFMYLPGFEPLVEVADIVKIDAMALDRETIRDHASRLKSQGIALLGEKIESYDEYEFLKSLGFDYFQGYFFARPKVISGKAITPNQLAVLELVSKVNDPAVDVDELSRVIGKDLSLSHKVMKFVNAPANGLRAKIDSIHQAVVLLGLTTIKNWVTILALATGSNKPAELSKTALIRGRSCELIARKCKLPKPDGFFTAGLFSALDAIMDQPLALLLEELPLTEEAKNALLERAGVMGDALDRVLAMEQGNFSFIGFDTLAPADLADLYLDAIHWCDEISNGI